MFCELRKFLTLNSGFVLTYDSWSRPTGPDSRGSHRSAENWGCSGLMCTGNVLDDTSSALEAEPSRGWGCEPAECRLKGETVNSTGDSCHLPQSRSSELSPQSLSLSHSQFPGMHCSLSQRNSLSEHGLGATHPQQEHIQSREAVNEL